MSSKGDDRIDLSRDLPVTAEDIAALAQLRKGDQKRTPEEYLLLLNSLPPLPDSKRDDEITNRKPFTL